MPRRLYGASPADFVIGVVGGVSDVTTTTEDVSGTTVVTSVAATQVANLTQIVPGQALAVATDPAAEARITTGLESLDGTAVTEVVSDANGEVRFYATDQPSDLWVAPIDNLGNISAVWYVIRAADIGARLDAIEGAEGPGGLATRVSELEADLAALRSDFTAQVPKKWLVLDEQNGVYTPPEGHVGPRWFRGATFPPAGMWKDGDVYMRVSVTNL